MRLVRALLFVTLTGSLALADDAPAPSSDAKPAETTESTPAPTPTVKAGKVPLRVVKMLPETHQVLLYDKNRGTHVVAEAGQDIDGYIVDEIDDDEVTLVGPTGAEVILTSPDMSWRRRAAERKAATAKAAAATGTATAAPVDPYGDAADAPSAPAATAAPTTEGAPADPYADAPASSAPVRVTSAGGASTAPAPIAASPATPAAGTASPAASSAPAAPVHAPAAPASPPGADELAAALTGDPVTAPPPTPVSQPAAFTLSRADVDAALADFGATAVTFDARFTAEGLRFDAIAPGTLLTKAGLQKGDTITAIDGKPLRSFDDAATLYARMGKASKATVQVLRAGKPVTLRVAIR